MILMKAVNSSVRATQLEGLAQSTTNIARAGAGRCVACGLCLPHCPTYRKTKFEAESPRGRIALILALDKGTLEPTPQFESHLSQCLLCRACESVCPAAVPFGDVMDAARAQLLTARPVSMMGKIGLHAVVLLTRNPWAASVAWILWCYQKSGLQSLLRKAGILRHLGLAEMDAEFSSPITPTRFASHYPAQGVRRGTVALFTGCVARLTDAPTLLASIRLLTRLGYDVRVPPQQTCCGALHRHAGDTRTADKLRHRNREAFDRDDIEAIITAASGCAATLMEYRGDGPASRIAAKITDISEFLEKIEWPRGISLRPLPKRIAVHDPCTLRNVMHATTAPYSLLRRIPQTEVVALPDNAFCCGAAGAYHLEHKTMARSLRHDKLDSLHRVTPDVLATSNPGCAMFLQAGLRQAGLTIEIVHPVTLLDRQLAPPAGN